MGPGSRAVDGRPVPDVHDPDDQLAVSPVRQISPAVPARPSPNMPNNPPDEGNPVAQQTDDRSPALKPVLDSMTLLVAAVIVHDKATN